MSRSAILPLPDDQAAILVRGLPSLLDAHPAGSNNHRPFVRDFLRLVHAATGNTYSAPIIRKLLAVYAPGRSPSTDTLALEKRALDLALAQESAAGREIDAGTETGLASVVQRAIASALAKHPIHNIPAAHDSTAHAQRDFLLSRLNDAERMLWDVRAQAARLTGELQAAQAVQQVLQAQLDVAQVLNQAQAQRIERMTLEWAGMRDFAMTAIDVSRGETRAQKERAAHLETLLHAEKQHAEVFRRLAYRNGAPIPDSLQPDGKA